MVSDLFDKETIKSLAALKLELTPETEVIEATSPKKSSKKSKKSKVTTKYIPKEDFELKWLAEEKSSSASPVIEQNPENLFPKNELEKKGLLEAVIERQGKKFFEVTLTAVGPIFIGSGNQLRKNEYLYSKDTQQVKIIDQKELTKILIKTKKFDHFLNQAAAGKKDLHILLRELGLNKYEKEYVTQTLNVNLDKDGKNNLNDLNLFIRNGLGEPYIPGSSLKGALRTVILKKSSEDTKEHPAFKSLSVSDSQPLQGTDFEIYQKMDYNKTAKGLPLFREAIKPGTKVTFSLNFNESELLLEEIKNGLHETFEIYQQHWLSGFTERPTPSHYETSNSYYLYLGGGAGFASKTLHYKESPILKAKKDICQQLKSKAISKKAYGQIKNISIVNIPLCLKMASHQNRFQEMGLCRIEFKEVKS